MALGFLRLTASLAATTAIGLAGAEIAADLRARSELRRIVAAQPGLTFRAVRVEPFGGRLVIEGIAADRGHGSRVTIGRLTLARPAIDGLVTSARAESALDAAIRALGPKPPAASPPSEAAPPADPGASAGGGAEAVPAAPASGGAVTGTASAENVVVTSAGTTWRIKRIDLTGTTLSNADLAKLLDATSGETAQARLRKLNATSIDVPEILVDDPTAGSEGHAVFSRIKLSGVVAGRATAASIAGVTVQTKTGDETTTGSVGATQAFGVDFAQVAHVFGTVRRDDSEKILPLYDSATVNGIKASSGKGTFSLAVFKETGAKARPLKTDIFAERKAGEKRSKAEDAALFADMSQSFEVGSMELVDLVGRSEDAKEPGGITLASFGLRGFGGGKIGGLSLRGLRVEAPTVKLALGSADVGPFRLPKSYRDPVGSANVMAQSAGKVDFDKIDVDVTSKDAAKGDQRVKFAIGHTSFASEGTAGEIPTKVGLAIDNVVFDMPADSGQAKPLADMGYRHLDLSAGLAATYDAATQELKIRDLKLKGVDMGSLGLGLHLLNVTKGVISPDHDVQKVSALAVLARELTVDVANDGLVDRAIEWKAKQDGMTVDAEKASIIEFFDKGLPAQFNSANVKIVGTAIARFVAAPKKLHIGILSKSGFGAGSLALLNDPGLLIDSLEVTANAN